LDLRYFLLEHFLESLIIWCLIVRFALFFARAFLNGPLSKTLNIFAAVVIVPNKKQKPGSSLLLFIVFT